MTPIEKRALAYVANTGGNATVAHFNEDHDPIGPRLWQKFMDAKLVEVDGAGKIHLTDAGKHEADVRYLRPAQA